MASESDSSFGYYRQWDETQERPEPLSNDEMRKAIDKRFNEDAVWDAATDMTLAALKSLELSSYDFFSNHESQNFRLTPERKAKIEELRSTCWDMIKQHNLPTELKRENALEDRFRGRARLLRTDPEKPAYKDKVLDAAKEVLKLPNRPYVQWPEAPTIADIPPSLHRIAEVEALRGLGKALVDGRASSLYSCGGEIPIVNNLHVNTFREIDGQRCSAPVLVRWDSTPSMSRRLHFPVATDLDNEAFPQLLVDCQPATFGRGGDDVLDESYRKAGKLDSTQFSSSFNIYESGILDEVARWLLPGSLTPTKTGQPDNQANCSISAELYKLNIYSGPLGRFRSHVDTPRAANHFASLVICLPYQHCGGALVIRHEGTELIYDWSSNDPVQRQAKIGWAAFYSDCEHEVQRTESGHRITLAYNLYVTDRVDWTLKQPNPHFDPSQSILYNILRPLLLEPAFMKHGGVLGIPCSHKYAQTSGSPHDNFPTALKGIDLGIYEAIRALELPVKVAPIIRHNSSYGGVSLNEFLKSGGLEFDKSAHKGLRWLQKRGDRDRSLNLWYEDEESAWYSYSDRNHNCRFNQNDSIVTEFASRVEELKAIRRGKVIGLTVRYISGKDVIIGTGFRKTTILERGGQDCGPDQVLDEEFPHVSLPTLTWLCELPEAFEETQLAHMAYGNESFMYSWYVSVVIIVVIPRSIDRPLQPSTGNLGTETK